MLVGEGSSADWDRCALSGCCWTAPVAHPIQAQKFTTELHTHNAGTTHWTSEHYRRARYEVLGEQGGGVGRGRGGGAGGWGIVQP